MSDSRSFLLACGVVAVLGTIGCGTSPPASAPPASQAAAPGEATNLGSAPVQPNPGATATASAGSATTPAVAPPTIGPITTGPINVGPINVGPSPSPAPTNAPATTGQTASGASVPAPNVNGPTVTGQTVPPPVVTSSVPSATPASPVPAAPVAASPSATTPAPVGSTPSPTAGAKPAGALASGDMAGLAAAANQWRLQGTNLVGVKRFDDKPVGAGYSWMTHLLPYVGYGELYAKFDFTKGWHEKENLPHACEVIPAFLDPSNPAHNMQIFTVKNAIGPAFTHFVGMSGVEDSRNLVAASLPRSDPRAGIFGYDQIARPEEITDGASNTIMMISSGKIVGPWASGGGGTIRAARMPYFDAIAGFGSVGDPGAGALVAMADGSVKRISKDIDPAVFRALCTIHGAETIDMAANASVIRAP